MKKKIFSILASSLIVIVSSVLLAFGLLMMVQNRNKVETGNILGVSWYNETDSEFVITTAEQLFELAELSEFYDFNRQTIKLGADIVINEGNASEWAENAPSKKWIPIKEFKGTFDGQGHSISGLYGKGFDTPIALFIKVDTSATIQNLKLLNSYFQTSGESGTASFAAYGGGKYIKLYSDAIIDCKGDHAGGIASHIHAQSTVEECWFDGTINITGRDGGGIIDEITKGRVNIKHCLFSGIINSEYAAGAAKIGGLCGNVAKEGTLVLTDSLASGTINAKNSVYTGGFLGVGYSGTNVTVYDSYVSDATYNSVLGSSGKGGTFVGNAIDVQAKNLIGYESYRWTTLDFEKYWAVVLEDTPILKCFATDIPSLEGIEKAYDISWYTADGTVFTISTVPQFYGFQMLSSSKGFAGKTVKLGADITLNTGNAKDWEKNAPELSWRPIQNFDGTFDGQGHTISGIYYKDTSSASSYRGLFGLTAVSARIKNFRLTNSYFERTNDEVVNGMMGSIVGDLRGSLDTVYSDAIIKCNGTQVGGLVGRANGIKQPIGNATVNINNCWYDGELYMVGTKATNAGGIVGIAVQGNVNILHCLNTGTLSSEVTGTGVHLGGILGGDWSVANIAITDCLNVGELKVNYTAAIGSVLGRARSGKTVVTITDTYATKESYGVAVSTSGLNGTINGGVMQFTKDKLTGNGGYEYTTLDFADYWTIVKNGTPVLKSFAGSTVSVAGLKKAFDTSWYSADAKEMVIDSVEDLYGFTFLSAMNNFKGQTIKLGKDIAVNTGNAADWGTSAPSKEWYPIGNSSKKFAGNFDGQGHTISGIYYKDSSENSNYGGLFGMTDVGSTVRNFRLVNSYFERNHPTGASGMMGSIVGDLRGNMDTIYSEAIVISNSPQTGGLVGRANAIKKDDGNETVTISNCWYNGKLHMNDETTARYAGGIVGVAIQGNINIIHCLNSGELISDVTNTGVHIGGILGSDWSAANVKIADTLSTGKLNVNWTAAIGSVVGRVRDGKSVVTIENTFATYESYKTAVSTSGLNGKVNGSVVQFSEEMIVGYDGYRFTSLDFKDYWAVVENDTPALQSFVKTVPSVADVERLFDIGWYDKDAKTMVIDSVAELYGVYFMAASTDFAGQTIELGKDITVNSGAMSNWENEWFPIGNSSKRFAGTFDGKGHIISGLYVTPESAGDNYAGLFGCVAPKGVVQNFELQNSYIETTANDTGSIVGELRGTLNKVKSDATVKSSVNKIGGLVGRASVSVNISDCWFDGDIIMACEEGYAGGIVGAAVTGTVRIAHCLNTGNITMDNANTALYAGGFVGTDWAVVTIEIEDCLNIGPLTESGHPQAASVLGTFRSRTSSISMANTYASKEESLLTVGATMGTISGNAITYDKELLKGYGGYQYTTLNFNPDTGYWAVVADSTPILQSFASTIPSIGADVERKIDVSWFDEKAETLELDSAADLFGFSCIASYHDFAGQTVELKDDITLNEGEAASWELGNNTPAVSWTPIGNSAVPFRGEFEGNRHTISGLYLKDTSTTSNFTGLFGVTATGSVVRNFQLKNSYIERKGNNSVYGTGSIVGLSYGDLEYIYSDAIVKVDGTIQSGGLVGRSQASHDITSCWFDGKLIMTGGATYGGGILGIVYKSTVTMTDTLFTGIITSDVTGGYPSIGGLLGTDHEAGNATVIMTNCISAGDMQVAKLLSVGSVLGAYYAGNSTYEITNVYGVLDDNLPAIGRLRGGYTDGTPIEVSKLELSGYNIYTAANVNIALGSTWVARKDDVVALKYFAGKTFSEFDIVTCDTKWYTGDASTYEIDTADEFYGFMLLSHQGETFDDELIRLTDNIALNTIKDNTLASWENGTYTFVNNWIPIGSTSFNGDFDGGKHTIQGLYLKTDKSNVGLFGVLNGGTISNVKLTDSYLENTAVGATENLGSIVGKASGTLINVYSNATIKAAGSGVGGVVGAATSPSLRLTSCWYAGKATVVNTVKAAYFGGLLGHITSGGATIDTCLFTGNMSYTLMCPDSTWGTINAGIGGFCGADRGYVLVVNNSVSAGNVSATWDQEGAAGSTSAGTFRRITGVLGNAGCANSTTNGKVYDATVVNVKITNTGANNTFTKSYEGSYTFATQTIQLNALKNAAAGDLTLLTFERAAGDTTSPIWYKEAAHVPVPETLKSMIRKEGQ